MKQYGVIPQITNIPISGVTNVVDINNYVKKNAYFTPALTRGNRILSLSEIFIPELFPQSKDDVFTYIEITDFEVEVINYQTQVVVKKLELPNLEYYNIKGNFTDFKDYINGEYTQENSGFAVKDPAYYVNSNDLTVNDYIVRYRCRINTDFVYGFTSSNARVYYFKLEYKLFITDATEEIQNWNAWTVLQRILNVVEPLRKYETPRFELDSTQREWLESIETPELQITNSTLREALQVVGSYIHAEPRLKKVKYEEIEDYAFVITFDKYGGNEYSAFPQTYFQYASKSNSINIESFATNLDSSVGNFVNSFDNSVGGSISEPFIGGYKSVLAEGTYVRITDETMYISTLYPIREIKKLTCFYNNENVDITPYVYEYSKYRELSSYENIYPTSKVLGIYYTLGQKGVYGLNFKREQIFSEWGNYSIINILNASVSNLENPSTTAYEGNYWDLYFNIEYVPIYPARVQQNKSLIESGKEWTKPYNQGQNLVETKYYGENLKGVIARLGNVDKTVTYVIPDYPTVLPKVGELYDDEYYISDTAIELQPFYTKLTLALSKNFNRYSEYVGVNSVKRMYEISEQQAFNSEISYREFCVFGDDVESSIDTLLQDYKENIGSIFNYSSEPKKIAGVSLEGIDYNDKTISKTFLPIISSAMGNSCIISFKAEDNYSAGTYSQHAKLLNSNSEIIDGAWTQTTPYSDYYGRIKYLNIDFVENPTVDIDDSENYLLPPNNNTDWISGGEKIISTGNLPLLVEKGSTEILSFNYQLEFVTKDKDIIIGSALARNLNFIRTRQENNVYLILFKNRLNKFNSIFDSTQLGDNAFRFTNGINFVNGNTFNQITFDSSGYWNAWALALKLDTNKYELLLGKNMPIQKGTELFQGLKFAIVSEKDLYR